ncbi:beta-lactamase family protein [Mucilaginibacter mali]|uniref:Beta-lactamase family protein n=1 Tax=Mucilaginibacter mali TaxID=2740462 RepID=A0A7D4PUT8_9SPHI|nr:serine hydrolase domain-containing protein [Mucilaginibacter mali]QKJ31028.1 beta-lactamase family protein [Mucilaginibacter mali]
MKFRKIPLLCISLLLLVGGAYAQSFNTAKMDSLLDAVNANNKGMGSLAITHNGKIVYRHAIGYAAYPEKIQATPETKYRIGSISKMFTTCLIFQLVEEGKLTLDTKLAAFYPQLPNASKITIGMMLQHRSGLHNFTNDAAYLSYMTQPKTHDEMLAIIAKQTSDFEPDSKADYSNTNFVLLGYIAEKITKTPYPELVKKRVVDKIGLKDTYYGGKINTADHEAHSYKAGAPWISETQTDMSIPGGAGAMVSTATDLDHFIEALFAGKIINKEHVAMMQTIKEGFGMGMFRYPVIGKTGFGHTGGIDGFGSQVIYFPADEMAICYIHNADAGAGAEIIQGAIGIYFNKPYAIPNFKTANIKSEDLDKFLGEYASPGFPLVIAVSKNGNTLTAQATGQGAFPLTAISSTVFEFTAANIVMEFDATKKQMTLKQSGHTTLFTKKEADIKLSSTDLDKYLGVYASPGVPLKITVTKDNTTLMLQATGQGSFPVTPIGVNLFEFTKAGIIAEFDPAKKQLVLKQAGRNTIFTKE